MLALRAWMRAGFHESPTRKRGNPRYSLENLSFWPPGRFPDILIEPEARPARVCQLPSSDTERFHDLPWHIPAVSASCPRRCGRAVVLACWLACGWHRRRSAARLRHADRADLHQARLQQRRLPREEWRAERLPAFPAGLRAIRGPRAPGRGGPREAGVGRRARHEPAPAQGHGRRAARRWKTHRAGLPILRTHRPLDCRGGSPGRPEGAAGCADRGLTDRS